MACEELSYSGRSVTEIYLTRINLEKEFTWIYEYANKVIVNNEQSGRQVKQNNGTLMESSRIFDY